MFLNGASAPFFCTKCLTQKFTYENIFLCRDGGGDEAPVVLAEVQVTRQRHHFNPQENSMSAYICNPSHIAFVACWATAFDQFATPAKRVENATKAAKVLAEENIRSVSHRYPDQKDGERCGPRLTDQQIVDLSVLWAENYASHRNRINEPVQAIKLAHCLDYQSCEHPDYETSEAAKLIRQAIYTASTGLVGYKSASRDWSDQNPSAAIVAYFEGEAA
jgi:hypothetical protein